VGRAKQGLFVALAALVLLVAAVESHATPFKKPVTEQSVKRVIGVQQWNKAMRVARCETGATLRWYPHGTYIGMLGMYRGTYALGMRRAGIYKWPDTASRAEQIAIAVSAFPATRGWSGWGCGGA
jgi:hypothetical protein